MSAWALGQGFNEGVSTGIELGNAVVKRNANRSITDANEIYAEMMGMEPSAPAPPGAIPVEGAEAAPMPVGYDGMQWGDAKQRYVAALKNVTDPQQLKLLESRMADLEKEKVMSNGRNALLAIRNGDTDSAQKFLANISYYTDAGFAPAIQVRPDGTSIIEDPETGSATVLTPNNLEEYLHQVENFTDYRKFAFDRAVHNDLMEYRGKVLALDAGDKAARLALDERKTDAVIKQNEAAADLAQTRLEHEVALQPLEMEKVKTQVATASDANTRAEEMHRAALDKDSREAFEASLENMDEMYQGFFSDPSSLAAGGDGFDPLMGDLEDMTDMQRAQLEKRQQSEMYDEEARARKAALRAQVARDPRNAVTAALIMSGLRQANDTNVVSDQLAASIAFGFVTEPKGENEFSFDPDTNTLIVSGQAYSVPQTTTTALQNLTGAAPTPPPQGGGASGIPAEQ